MGNPTEEQLIRENRELRNKLESLLFHATNGNWSGADYPIEDMKRWVDDAIDEIVQQEIEELQKDYHECAEQLRMTQEELDTIQEELDTIFEEYVR